MSTNLIVPAHNNCWKSARVGSSWYMPISNRSGFRTQKEHMPRIFQHATPRTSPHLIGVGLKVVLGMERQTWDIEFRVGLATSKLLHLFCWLPEDMTNASTSLCCTEQISKHQHKSLGHIKGHTSTKHVNMVMMASPHLRDLKVGHGKATFGWALD